MFVVLARKATANQIQTSATTLCPCPFARRRQEHPSKPILKAFHCEYTEFPPGVMNNFVQLGRLE